MMAGDSAAAMSPNPDTVSAALGMFCPIGPLLLVLIDPRRTSGNVTGRTFTMPGEIEQAVAWVVERNAAGWNAYWTPNEARPMSNKSGKKDMVRARYFWVDCDPVVFKHGGYDGARQHLMDERLPQLRAKASFVIDSGHGLQAFWLLAGGPDLRTEEARNTFEALNVRLGALYGSEGTQNCDRVMRVPGTINYPNAAKVSNGYPVAPTMARLLAADGTAWTVGEIAGEVARAEIGARWDDVLAKHPAIRSRWDGDTSGLRDPSGSGMDQSMVTMLCLAGWNLEDIRRALEHWKHGSVGGRQQGTRHWDRMWKNAVRYRDRGAAVSLDMDAILEAAQAAEQAKSAAGSDAVPVNLLTIPGALGLAVDWINATARKPQPLLAVQAAIALGSVVIGRRYRTTNGNWSMLYLLNVAQSGAGKEHAKYAVETLLEAAGLASLIGAGRFASESSVTSALIEKPAHFSVLDEFGKMLQSASVAQNYADRNTLKALMEVWGRADGVMRPVAYSTAGLSSKQSEELAKRMVRKPSLTMMAMATGETLFGGLTSAAVADGFLGRYLTVHADRGRQMARTVDPIEPPAKLIEWIQTAHAGVNRAGNMVSASVPHDMEPTPIVVEFDSAALAAFAALERRTHARMDELDAEGLAEMLTRTTEMAMRLGLIVALSCDSLIISRQHAQWACEYVEHHSDRNIQMLRERLSEGPFDQLCKEIRRLVVKSGAKGMTERDLDKSSRFWRASQDRMRIDALSSLRRREEITLVDIPSASGRGRKRQAYMDSALVNSADNADKPPTEASPDET